MLLLQFFNLVILFTSVRGSDNIKQEPTKSSRSDIYEDALDPEQCEKQISYMFLNNSMLFLRFLDAGPRTPKGILGGNFFDLGSYNECLGIEHKEEDMSVEGKYCLSVVPLSLSSVLPETASRYAWPNLNLREIYLGMQSFNNQDLKRIQAFERERSRFIDPERNHEALISRMSKEDQQMVLPLFLAFCVPKVCTTKQALDLMTLQLTENLGITEAFCRLPNDKPRVAADYVATVIFSIIGLLTILSTGYDIRHSVLQKKDPKEANKICMLFSVYTNTRRLFTFKHNPNAIDCLDGIRSLAMMWIVLGHTFSQFFFSSNGLDVTNFTKEFTSLWITSVYITVDTFFMLSGLLLVYTTAHKLSGMMLLKNLHLFYLNRLLRMFPILATAILLQASYFNRITDGPIWFTNTFFTNNCRENWWSTLLYVQNYVHPHNQCLQHAWYLAIDMQCYVLSPIVLYWILSGNKKVGWIAVIGALLAVMTAATTYIFIMELPSSSFGLGGEQGDLYTEKYYLNTLTRASPFLVGMVLGYILHLHRGTVVIIPKILVAVLWLLAATLSALIIVSNYFVMQDDWNNQTVDSLLNSFMRPVWTACVGWMVFACKHGYGGPIDWFLSLHIFKILSRLSYGIYIMHLSLQNMVLGTILSLPYFTVEFVFHRYLIDFSLAVLAAILVMVLIDAPCSGIIRLVLGGSKDAAAKKKKNDDLNTKTNIETNNEASVEISKKPEE